MRAKYHYGHRAPHHPIIHVIIIGLSSLVVVGAIILVLIVVIGHDSKPNKTVMGSSEVVGQVLGNSTISTTVPVQESTYDLTLPEGWHQTANLSTVTQDSTTWESGPVDDEARYLTVYVDRIPPNIAINRLLPIVVHDQTVSYGSLSDNCANFTSPVPGSNPSSQPAPAKWQGINFLCDIPNRVQDVVGTSQMGDVNGFSVEGPEQGTHTYFITYTDDSAEADYNIFYQILDSFKAT